MDIQDKAKKFYLSNFFNQVHSQSEMIKIFESFAHEIHNETLEKILAPLYQEDPQMIAKFCDEKLDTSGGLLGRIRSLALVESKENRK